jgi:hypothetical protein
MINSTNLNEAHYMNRDLEVCRTNIRLDWHPER